MAALLLQLVDSDAPQQSNYQRVWLQLLEMAAGVLGELRCGLLYATMQRANSTFRYLP